MAVKKTPAHSGLELRLESLTGLGLKTNATMLTGIGEDLRNKVDHMLLLRDQQDPACGFMCFIPLKCYYEGPILRESEEPALHELAQRCGISRILLDNFPAYQSLLDSAWGSCSVGLSFGADDMDGTIGEEKITHAAGAKTPIAIRQRKMEFLIAEAGQTPVERDTFYNIQRLSELPPRQLPSLAARLENFG